MSLSRDPSFFMIYARSGYVDKMNPEFSGIAKKFYNQKKEHDKVNSIKAKLDREVAVMQRMQSKMEKHLQKKQFELKHAKEVSSRFQNDLIRREWIQEYQQNQSKLNRQKASLIKSHSLKKIKESKDYLIEHKRSLANINRSENERIKEARMLKRAQEWDLNRSRVSQIYQFKKDVKGSCDKFYQSRTGSSQKNYQSKIEGYQKSKEVANDNIESLQQRLVELSKNSTQKKEKSIEIMKQIEKIKQNTKIQHNLIRSQLRSRSSSSSFSIRSKQKSAILPHAQSEQLKKPS